jgi:hypothetical protein
VPRSGEIRALPFSGGRAADRGQSGPNGNMALSNRQLQLLRRLAKNPRGGMTKFEVLKDVGRSSLGNLLKGSFVIGTRELGGLIEITRAGRDAVSNHDRNAWAESEGFETMPPSEDKTAARSALIKRRTKTIKKRPGPARTTGTDTLVTTTKLNSRSFAADRQLIEMAKTLDLAAMVRQTGRKPEAILRTASRLCLSIRGKPAKINRKNKT